MDTTGDEDTILIGEADLASMRRDRAAADALIDRHLPYVYNLALRATGRREDAMAVSRDAIVNALVAHDWSKGSDVALLRTSLARNIAQLASVRRPEIPADERSSGLPELARVDSGEAGRDIHGAVRTANLRLTPNERITLALRDKEGADDTEIGTVLGVPSSRVPGLIEGARLALYNELEPDLTDPRSLPACRETPGTITSLVDGTLHADRAIQIRTHLNGCERCNATHVAVFEARRRYQAWPPVPVPPELSGMVRTAAKERDLLGLVVPAGPDDILASRGRSAEEVVERSPWVPLRIGLLVGTLGLLMWAALAEHDPASRPVNAPTTTVASAQKTAKKAKGPLRAIITPNRNPKRVPGIARVVASGAGAGALGGVGGPGSLGSVRTGVATIVGVGGTTGSSNGSSVGNLQVVPRAGTTAAGTSSSSSGSASRGSSPTTVFDGTNGNGGSRSALASGGSGSGAQRGVLVVEQVGSATTTSPGTTGSGTGRGTSGLGSPQRGVVVVEEVGRSTTTSTDTTPTNAGAGFAVVGTTGGQGTGTTSTTTTAPTVNTATTPAQTPTTPPPPGATTTSGTGVWVWCPQCYVAPR